MALGAVVLTVALLGAAGPFRQTQEFRAVVDCEHGLEDCFAREPATIAARRTYTTTSTSTDANGHTSTTTTTHYEVTWQRPDGQRQARDVGPEFYEKAREGLPADLRTWRGEVVGVEVMGAAAWFLPASGESLSYWLYLAHLGLGMLLWGLIFGWWDGFFMLIFRGFAWMFLSFIPVHLLTQSLAFGLEPGVGLVVEIGFGLAFLGIAGWMLISTLD
ncbi:hypothetical protein [Microlunatus speluncae]|uniref:hypothetical protein n=1 Tax=Microlunatus speluncae TaxID=2594267 RepID=UPI0012661CA6|nr:hypothetical protein [Microlunatus speluncae]